MSSRLLVVAIASSSRLTLAVSRQRTSHHHAVQLAEFAREADQPLILNATAGGDPQRLRGIPAVGGVTGTIRGTQPEAALLSLDARGLLHLVRHDYDGTSPGTQPEEALLAQCA